MARITDSYLKRAVPEKDKKVLSIRIETNLSVQIKKTAQNNITRSFVFRSVLANGKSYSEYLGTVFDLTISEARQLAQERRELLRQGEIPKLYIKNALTKKIQLQKKQETTMQVVLDHYLAKRINLSKNTHIHDQTMINYVKPLFNVTISELEESRIPYDLINDCINKGQIAKAKVVASFINQLMETAIDYNLINRNYFIRLKRLIPSHTVTHFTSVRPDHVQEDLIEIFKIIFKKNKLNQTNLYFLLGLYTLLRPVEVAALKKSNWNRENQTLFVEKTKTLKDGWIVQTNDLLNSLLAYIAKQSEYNCFFNGSPVNVVGRLNDYFRRHKIKFTSHGWRSAGMNWLVQNNVPIHIANALLTHKIGDAVTLSYMRSDLPKERKESLYLWNEFITLILEEKFPLIHRQIFKNVN